MVFLITFVMLLGLVGLMSVGVVFGGKRLKGSCGGVGASCACDEAGRPRRCEVEKGSGELSEPAALAALPAPGAHGESRRRRSGALPDARHRPPARRG
jgi:hypothetical protein